ncbi:MAG TPA: hypothetical protein VGO00_17675, partial [Kofleriaceae bacterium]|nr:hypothetical protein [Kofleriaceae bacterium]
MRAGRPLPASGHDVMDAIVAALASVEWPSIDAWRNRRERAKELEIFVGAVTMKRRSHLARRAAVALASYFASHPPVPVMVAACAALEPRTIELGLDTMAAATGLVRFGWPVSATPGQVERLVKRSAGDLALAAALVGLLPSGRLDLLAKILGDDAIVTSLVASDNGWDEICMMCGEGPALDMRWLNAVWQRDRSRYMSLHARAILQTTGKRRERFVDSTARQSRRSVFGAALLGARDTDAVTAICRAIGDRLDRTTLVEIVVDMLVDAERGGPIVLGLVRAVSEKLLASAITELDDGKVARVIGILDGPDAPPRDRELAIARVVAARTDPTILAWAARVSTPSPAPIESRRLIAPRRTLDHAEKARIASCSARELARAVEPALTAPVAGLVEALDTRSPQPCDQVCAALLGCADPVDAVARQLDRFAASTREFEIDLDNAATVWRLRDDVSPLAHARLYRWEHHIFALTRWIDSMGGTLAALRHVELQPGWLFAHTMWRGISEAVMFFRYRDAARFHRDGTVELAEFATERVDRHYGHHAARIVVALVEGRAVPVIAIRSRVLDRIADANAETRAYAARLVRLDGIPEPVRSIDLGDPRDAITEIRTETDLDRLVGWCADPRATVVQEAALALVIAGAPGQRRLAELLSRLDSLTVPLAVLATVALWDLPAAIDRARELAAQGDLPAAWRFHLAVALGDLPRAFESARDTTTTWYFRREDWESLVRVAGELATAIAVADAPHHHAYQRAIPVLLAHDDPAAVGDALRRFLEVDGERPLYLRRSAARYLAERLGDFTGLPLLVEQVIDDSLESWEAALAAIPDAAIADAVELVVSAALIGGHAACSERRMWAVVERARNHKRVDRDILDRLCGRVLEDASLPQIRRAAAAYAISPALEDSRLSRVAEVFAWGVRRGVELTGRMFRFRATGKESDLGHTNLKSSEVFVSPLPMLRGEPHGQDVVEGLVLHELGHHIYHRGSGALELWKRAHAEGIGHLLNLIADEHLERNLRGVDAAYGDRLKRLDAYAFHHAPQEIPVAKLLASLRGSAARALIATDLGVAYDDKSVRLRRGEVIATLDRAGHPLARFMRALRMGLGNRHGDPLVAAALSHCGPKLRDLDMTGLYD